MNSCIFESVEFLNEFDEMKTLSEGAKFDLFASRFAQEGEDYSEIKKLVTKVAKDSKMDNKELQKHSKGVVYNIKRCLQVACDMISNASSGATTASSIKYLKDVNKTTAFSKAVNDAGRTVKVSNNFENKLLGAKYMHSLIAILATFLCSRVIRYCVDVAEFASIRKDAREMVTTLREKAKDTSDEKAAGKMRDQADKIEREVERRQGWFDKQVESIENKFKKK